MNGYTLMSESYRKLINEGKIEREDAEKEIRIFEFLASCDQDDLCRLVDSSAFNDIIKGYMKVAVEDAGVEEKAKSRVLDSIYKIFDSYSAKEIMDNHD